MHESFAWRVIGGMLGVQRSRTLVHIMDALIARASTGSATDNPRRGVVIEPRRRMGRFTG
jgi:hypothetical protein